MRISLIARVVAFASVVLLAVASCSSGADDAGGTTTTAVESYSGYVVDPPSEVGQVSLPLADGSGSFEMEAAPEGLELVYFGYTFCPDVCPTTMSDLRRAIAELPDDEADRVGVAMVTIDPGRDSADVLSGYVANFIDDGLALRTDDQELLKAATSAFGANYTVETNDLGEIEVAHTGEVYAVDDTGTVVMQWPFGTSYESIARDLRSLLAEAQRA